MLSTTVDALLGEAFTVVGGGRSHRDPCSSEAVTLAFLLAAFGNFSAKS